MFVSPWRRCACGIMDFASCSSSLFSDSHPIPRRPRSQAGFELEDVCGTLMRFGACMAHLCGCTYLLSRSEYLTKTKTDARWTWRFSHPRQRPKACVRARTFGHASRGAAWSEAGAPARPISLTPRAVRTSTKTSVPAPHLPGIDVQRITSLHLERACTWWTYNVRKLRTCPNVQAPGSRSHKSQTTTAQHHDTHYRIGASVL